MLSCHFLQKMTIQVFRYPTTSQKAFAIDYCLVGLHLLKYTLFLHTNQLGWSEKFCRKCWAFNTSGVLRLLRDRCRIIKHQKALWSLSITWMGLIPFEPWTKNNGFDLSMLLSDRLDDGSERGRRGWLWGAISIYFQCAAGRCRGSMDANMICLCGALYSDELKISYFFE